MLVSPMLRSQSQAVLLAAMLLPSVLLAQLQISPGVPLQAVPFAAGPGETPAFPPTGAGAFPAFFYTLATGTTGRDILAYDSSGVGTVVATIAVDGGKLDFGLGANAGRLFVCEQSQPAGVALDGLYELTSNFNLTLFHLLGGGNPDPNDIEFPGASFGNFIYAANPTLGANGTNYDRKIVRLTSTGVFDSVFHSDSQGPLYMAASSGGPYGDYIYCSYLYGSSIKRIAPDGTVTTFANLSGNGSRIAFARGGALGTELYGLNQGGAMWRFDPAGNATPIGSGFSSKFGFDPASGDMIMHSGGAYVRITGIDASCTTRNGNGINPVACSCATLPVLGTTWDIAIAMAPNTLLTLAYASSNALAPFPLPFGEALIAPPIINIPGNGTHSVFLPNDPQFLGAELFVQGARLNTSGGGLALELTNAQDAVVGL